MPTENPAKKALDTVIRKSRVHLYKPIQIAEILFHHRTEPGLDLNAPSFSGLAGRSLREETVVVGM